MRERVDAATSGRGGVVSVAGPGGIGKTRLVEEALAHAKHRGCSDFLIRGFEPSAALPFWALNEALYLDPGASVDPAIGLAELRQALRGARDDAHGSTAGFEARDAAANARIYEAVTRVVRGITSVRPLALIVDDLQWIDGPTLDLLRYAVRLAKTLPLLLILSYREGDDGGGAWRLVPDDAAREGILTETHLAALEGNDARRLATTVAPAPLSDRAIDTVLRLAEGNPFYITQLAHAFATTPATEGRVPLPPALRGFTEQRLAGVSRGCRTLIEAIAIVGRQCSLGLIASISAMPMTELAAALEEALAAHVLVEREAHGRPRFDIGHALLRDAATRDLSAVARARLHLSVADALHARRPGGSRITAGEVAEHYLEARLLAPPERTLAYVREAADNAMTLGAPEQAAHFLSAAIGLLIDNAAAPEEVARLRLRLIEACGAAGDIAAAEREAAAALTHWRATGNTRAQVEVHTLLAEHLNPRLRPGDVVASAEAGLALLGDERGPMAARLRYLHAHARHMLDDSDGLLPAAGWLAAGGFDPPEPNAELWSRLLRILWSIWNIPDAAPTIALCREAVDHSQRTGDRRAEAMTRLWEAQVLTQDGRPREALWSLDEARRLAAETGSAPMLVDAGALRAEALLQLGRWRELEEVVEDTLPALVRLGSTYFGYNLVAAHSWSRRLRGLPWELPHGVTLRFPESRLFIAAYRTNTARQIVEMRAGDQRTDGLLDRLVAAVPAEGTGIAWATAAVPLLATLALAGRRDDVAARYDAAARFGRFLQYASFGPLEAGRAATLLRRWDEAEAHFDAAVELATAEELQPALARTLLERGAMYRQRGRRGDRARAATTLVRAAEMCSTLGMVPDQTRALDLLERLGPVAPPATPAGLTPRETEVLRLLADGCSNRQIAAALTISEKTVEQHLLNLYQKLQIDSRAKAVAFAYANGLVP